MWALLVGLGATLTVVGWTDLALLWYPLAFGSPEWEFGTISAHFQGMPVGTVGLVLLAAGAVGRRWRLGTRVLAIVFLLVTAGLLGVSMIYLLDMPVALTGVAEDLKPTLVKVMLKTSLSATAYVALYAWLWWFLWRKAGEAKRA